MTINIHAVRFHADSKLTEYINQRLTKLSKYFDRIQNVEVFLKLESHEQVKDKVVEIKSNLPGQTLIATAVDKSFEASIDDALNNLINQIKKYKGKLRESR